jgi:hypothetical protein
MIRLMLHLCSCKYFIIFTRKLLELQKKVIYNFCGIKKFYAALNDSQGWRKMH